MSPQCRVLRPGNPPGVRQLPSLTEPRDCRPIIRRGSRDGVSRGIADRNAQVAYCCRTSLPLARGAACL
jgi:hypothetical protein